MLWLLWILLVFQLFVKMRTLIIVGVMLVHEEFDGPRRKT